MPEPITDRVAAMIHGGCRMSPDDPVILGVSGGMDSIFLLTQLHKLGQPLSAAVFDHGLRPEAAEECEFVTVFCKERGIRCVKGTGDVRAHAEKNGMGVEEAARELRYRFLFRLAEETGAAAVATAHHANDQAETVLMHLLRGSGTDGLCGMRPYTLPNPFSRTIPLIRPLLGISRAEIEAAVTGEGLPYREDRSNSDPAYTRNRIRLSLIPELEKQYNPQIVPVLCRLAETAAADREILEDACDAAAERIGLHRTEAGLEWDRKAYCSERSGIRMRLLRRILRGLLPDPAEPGLMNLKEADDFFSLSGTNRLAPFFGGLWLSCEKGSASILKYVNTDSPLYPQLSDGWHLRKDVFPVTPEEIPGWIEKAAAHPECAFLDAARLVSEPFLRTIRPGERFRPYGNSGGSVKLSDFLINNKVPKQYRPGLAAAADTDGILWIPNLRVSRHAALTSSTRSLMILSLVRGE